MGPSFGRRRGAAPPRGDPAAPNMTPMIDMTFLLVVFFMLTIDLTSKEFVPVALPFATQGVEDTDQDAETPRVVLNLERSGRTTFKGQAYHLSTDEGERQSRALDALTGALRLQAADPRYRDENDHTTIPVLIHADRGTKWQYVQWLMQVCAKAGVGIYRVQFAVTQPTGPEEDTTAKQDNEEPAR